MLSRIIRFINSPKLKINEVGIDEFVKAGSEIDQYTTALRPCYGIGFLNTLTKESYLLHTPHPEWFELSDKIDMIKDDFGQDPVEVLVAGGNIDSPYGDEDIKNAQEKVEYLKNSLKKFKNVNYQFFYQGIYISKEENRIFAFPMAYFWSKINLNKKTKQIQLENLAKRSSTASYFLDQQKMKI